MSSRRFKSVIVIESDNFSGTQAALAEVNNTILAKQLQSANKETPREHVNTYNLNVNVFDRLNNQTL